jgi:hypothetical protein
VSVVLLAAKDAFRGRGVCSRSADPTLALSMVESNEVALVDILSCSW